MSEVSEPEKESAREAKSRGDLSPTALYTSYTWVWGRQPRAELFETPEAKAVFRVTNAALAVAKVFSWRLRSLRHSLLHRHTMIDHLLRESAPSQVLELAAGLSRRGATFSTEPTIRYTEVDLPPLIERKKALLSRGEEGREVLARDNLRLIAGDVSELALEPLVDSSGSVFVIAEGLLMYLRPDEQRRLWRRIASMLWARPHGGTFVFDLVPACEQPSPGIFGRSLEWLMKRFTKGRSFERDERTRDDVAAEVRAAGFAEVQMLEPAEVAFQWQLPYPHKKTLQLLFVCRVDPAVSPPADGAAARGGSSGSGGSGISSPG